jgi:uridine kinase
VTGFIKQNKPIIIGVAGGSGSGKTYFAQDLVKILGTDRTALVLQDNFYFDQSSRFDYDGGSVNFDHPDSIEFSLLAKHLRVLKAGNPTEIPTYDFATHSRKIETLLIQPAPIIIVDGILILHIPEVRALFDETIFFDTHENLRFGRRLDRDVRERGRTPEGVKEQFLRQVKPMHDQYVEPSKAYAKRVVCDEQEYDSVLEYYINLLK